MKIVSSKGRIIKFGTKADIVDRPAGPAKPPAVLDRPETVPPPPPPAPVPLPIPPFVTDGAHVTVELVPVVAVILDAAAAAAAEEAAAAAAERPALAFIAADNSICNSSQRTFSKAAYHDHIIKENKHYS
uniref:Uncharacterized protein n=1 Tax=Glossina pallidipes TaxID=7398 RepID=A0A1A9ZZJ6_GLOPL